MYLRYRTRLPCVDMQLNNNMYTWHTTQRDDDDICSVGSVFNLIRVSVRCKCRCSTRFTSFRDEIITGTGWSWFSYTAIFVWNRAADPPRKKKSASTCAHTSMCCYSVSMNHCVRQIDHCSSYLSRLEYLLSDGSMKRHTQLTYAVTLIGK